VSGITARHSASVSSSATCRRASLSEVNAVEAHPAHPTVTHCVGSLDPLALQDVVAELQQPHAAETDAQ